ncbi:hypothetical protein DAETH_45480 (plasmid) [Deinococcus aetherius]|uniref:Uncharacterized protein n=1 Tax=Deinococcus aetherius TaxID=200252 RepID=A0ABN6RRD5_9DEIO|nr:hypothetical protein [Deinococcus aetherius]BDP44579.1 hypothetical protein DAETH_45480 [Deinococcus aetherius]
MTHILTLRRALVVLGLLGLLGLAAELAAVGHWYGPSQLIPFAAILVGVLAGALYLSTERAWTRLAVRAAAALLVLTGAYGAVEHTSKNPELRREGRSGALGTPPEARPGESGVLGLPAPRPGWLNGPAPVSAPLAMSGLGLLLLLALYRREADFQTNPSTAVPSYSGD